MPVDVFPTPDPNDPDSDGDAEHVSGRAVLEDDVT
jgi:hypothetical protein